MTRSRGDDGQQSTGLELLLKDGVNLGVLLSLVQDSLNVVGLLLVGILGVDLGTSVDGLSVVGLVPLSEGGGINVNNGGFDEGLGSEQLVVGGVVSLASQRKFFQHPCAPSSTIQLFKTETFCTMAPLWV